MIIDISAYNGDINFNQLFDQNEIEKVILRATTSDGNPDNKLVKNVKAIMAHEDVKMDCYKFTYATDYVSAAMEAIELIYILKALNMLNMFDTFWLDIEPRQNHIHTKKEANEIIAAYVYVFNSFDLDLGIYCNYSYLKTIIPRWCKPIPIWLARWNDTMGDTFGYDVVMWQYSDKGQLAGISGPVDLSRYV